MPRKETCDFWVGRFENSKDYFDFLGEDPSYFEEDADSDKKYISAFAKSQGEHWIDHDFMESGFENSENPFTEKFKKYSYSSQWISCISEKISKTELIDINTVVFITKGRIKSPTSVSGSNFSLRYIGQIEYDV